VVTRAAGALEALVAIDGLAIDSFAGTPISRRTPIGVIPTTGARERAGCRDIDAFVKDRRLRELAAPALGDTVRRPEFHH
jgi:hypothetical protein